jgi:hypothetical protein
MDGLIDAIASQPYLITGGRALEHHQLTDQHFFGVIVLAASRVQKLTYRGQSATFLLTDPANIWGWEEGVHPQYATAERAIIDVLNHPRYAVRRPVFPRSSGRGSGALRIAVSGPACRAGGRAILRTSSSLAIPRANRAEPVPGIDAARGTTRRTARRHLAGRGQC